MKKLFTFSCIFLFFIPLISFAQKMTADEIIEKTIERYNEGMEEIQNRKVVTEDGITYERWEKNDDQRTYSMRSETESGGQKQVAIYDGEYYYFKEPSTGKVKKKEFQANPKKLYLQLQELDLDLSGEGEIEGQSCYILKTEDASYSDLPIDPQTAENFMNYAGEKEEIRYDGTIYIDTDEFIIRKMDITIKQMPIKQMGKRDVHFEMINKDFREISNLPMAFKTVNIISVEMTKEEKRKAEKARENMKEMKEKMENMPPEQKEMIKSRMEMANSIMMTGRIKNTKKIESVDVNIELDDKLFNPESLE